ncbi:MAG: hypothetical protein KDB23_28335 [Planctomycetales bacterium]|nr:hypothetical protein [Planctomycetales bacterium]
MTRIWHAMFMLAVAWPASAETIESAYTDLDVKRDCVVFSSDQDGGDSGNLICAGFRGYPVLIFTGDLRESVFYGLPPESDHVWESFAGFNSAGPKIEWRLSVDGDRKVPFATIHRWFVSDDPDDSETKTEVLVVEKIGQLQEREGCAVGYVVATGSPKANETARKIADEQVREFVCGADEPVLVSGDTPMPAIARP